MIRATSELQQINTQIREVRAEMKQRGIRRVSFMNGGHTPESYRLNRRMFELETQKKRLQVQP
jgi:hypothetical protein